MKLLKNKRGVSTDYITKIIAGVVGVVVLFLIMASLVPEAQTAGVNSRMKNLGYPIYP